MPLKEFEEIEVGKMWNEYSEQEKMVLPQLPKSEINPNGKTPYMWNGYFWDYVLID